VIRYTNRKIKLVTFLKRKIVILDISYIPPVYIVTLTTLAYTVNLILFYDFTKIDLQTTVIQIM